MLIRSGKSFNETKFDQLKLSKKLSELERRDTLSETNIFYSDDETPLIRKSFYSTNNLTCRQTSHLLKSNSTTKCAQCEILAARVETLNRKLNRLEQLLKVSPEICNWFDTLKNRLE